MKNVWHEAGIDRSEGSLQYRFVADIIIYSGYDRWSSSKVKLQPYDTETFPSPQISKPTQVSILFCILVASNCNQGIDFLTMPEQ